MFSIHRFPSLLQLDISCSLQPSVHLSIFLAVLLTFVHLCATLSTVECLHLLFIPDFCPVLFIFIWVWFFFYLCSMIMLCFSFFLSPCVCCVCVCNSSCVCVSVYSVYMRACVYRQPKLKLKKPLSSKRFPKHPHLDLSQLQSARLQSRKQKNSRWKLQRKQW